MSGRIRAGGVFARRTIQLRRFECQSCGNIASAPKTRRNTGPGHIKSMYCYICRLITNHAQLPEFDYSERPKLTQAENDMAAAVLRHIKLGRENAVRREHLCRLTELPDRQVRKAIEQLRQQGEPIVSSSQASGYWRTDNPAEIERYIRENSSRVQKLLSQNAAMTAAIKEMEAIECSAKL